jgi:fibronectin-binding autotransporter adhesin
VSAPLSFSGNTLSISQANASANGYLSSTDWTIFNNKISSTSLSSANGLLTYNSSTGVFTASTSPTFTAATTTSLGITGITSALLKTTSTGGVVAAVLGTDYQNFAYPFPSNATSTTLTLSGGFVANASSTIGTLNLVNALTVANGGTGSTSLGAILAGGGSSIYSVATTSASCSSGVSCSAFTVLGAGPVSITNTGVTNLTAGSGISISASTGAVTVTNSIGYPFPSNATSTLVAFNGGITTAGFLSTASSTINSNLVITGNSTTTNATTTALAISSITSSLLKTNATGGVVAAVLGTDYQNFAYPFPSNATSTLLTFSGGIMSLASTTIGAGSQITGLTISGGATTTGNSYLAGNVGIGGQPSTRALEITGTARVSSTVTLGSIASCTGSQALQTNGSGDISCGTIAAVSGASAAGGWQTNNVGFVSLSTTTDLVAVGATSTPYAKFTVLSGAAGTTTLALLPASGATANILDIFDTNGNLASVFTASHKFGIGTTSPSQALSVGGNAYISGGATTTSLGILGVTGSLLKTTATGGVVAAIAGTDYQNFAYPFPSNATSTTLTLSGGFVANASSTIGTLTLVNALTVPNGGTGSTTLGGLLTGNGTGAITAATVSAPLSFSGNTLSISQANASANGYLSSTDWTIFNNKISSTSLSSANGLLTYNSSTGVFTASTSPTFTAATTTSLGITGITSALLKTTSTGGVVAAVLGTDYQNFAYPFALAGNATSTLTQFNGGLTAYASTTIGNGAQTGGLTVSGGATTTGNSYFAGNVGIGTLPTTAVLSVAAGTNIFTINNSSTAPLANFVTSTAGLIARFRQSTIDNARIGLDNRFASGWEWALSDSISPDTYFTNNADTEVIRFTDAGSVGIGTTSPYAKLSVVGQVVAEYFTATSTTAANTFPLLVSTSATSTNLYGGTLTANTAAFGQTATSSFSSNGTLTAQNIINSGLSANQLIYTNASKQEVSVATGTVSSGTGISVTAGQYIVGPGLTITNTGVTAIAATSPLSVDASTGSVTLSISQANASTNGYLSSTDWTIFNNKISSTSLSSANGLLTYNSSTGVFTASTSPTFTAATTTSLGITGITSALLKTTSTGGVVAAVLGTDYQNFAYPFPSNATTTSIAFNGGLTATTLSVSTSATIASTTLSGSTLVTSSAAGGTALLIKQDATYASGAVTARYQNTNTAGQTSFYVENDRGGFASYGGWLYGGSGMTVGNQLFGVTRDDKLFFIADGANNLGMYVGTLNAQPVVFGTNNVERARFTSSGNLGIGTTSPYRQLSVGADAVFGNNVLAANFTATSTTASTFPYASTTAITATTASTTNLNISGISNSLLKTVNGVVTGAVAGTDYQNFAYPFPSNATSTTLTLSGGFVANASSTIGTLNLVNALTVPNGGTGSTSLGAILAGGGSSIYSVATGTVSSSNGLTVTAGQSIIGSGLTITGTNAQADGSTKGVSTYTAADFNDATGVISIDYTNGQKATDSVPGFLTAADWTTFNNKVSSTSLFSVVALAYPFALAGNATSTLTQFNGGLTAYASSTIGSGAQAGGLTVNGGATTTGNAVLQGGLNLTGAAVFSSTLNISGAITSTATGANTFPYASSTALTVSGTGYFGTATTTSLMVSGATTLQSIAANSLLYTNGSQQAAAASVSSPLSFAGGALSIQVANGSQNGYLSSTDWTIFNNKISSTSLSSANGLLTYNSSTGVFTASTSPTFTAATTTSLGITGITSALLKTTSTGGVVAAVLGTDYQNFAYPFPSNATSTTLTLSGGFVANASSTIGTLNLVNALTVANGGTGSTSLGAILAGGGSSIYSVATTSASCSSGVSCSAFTVLGAGPVSITNTGVTSIAGTANQITASAATGAVTLSVPSQFNIQNASTTNLSANTLAVGGTATTSVASNGALTIQNLTGLLKATAGLVSTATAGSDYENPLTFTYPLTRLANTISLAFGTSTSNTWGGTQTFTNAPVLSTFTGLVAANSGATYATATGTVSASNGLTVTAGQYIIGSGLTITGTNAAADGSTKGVSTYTASDFNDSAGLISIDYANGQKASGSQPGFLSSIDWTTFNNKISSTSLSATFPLAYNSSTGAFTFNGLSTSTAAVVGNIPYFTGVNTFGNVATGTVSSGTGISVTAGQYIIGSGLTITNTGVTSLTAGSGIALSGSTGAVTVTNSIGYPFPSNATTTLLAFNGGLTTAGFLSTASSTINSNLIITGNSTTTNATTTAFAISSVTSSLLKTTATGGIVAAVLGTDYQNFAYPFALAGNATSTLTQFNGGLTAYASTTIGNGAQTGGLTVSGGATTTGNSYFAGNVGIGTLPTTAVLSVAAGTNIFTINNSSTAPLANFVTSTAGLIARFRQSTIDNARIGLDNRFASGWEWALSDSISPDTYFTNNADTEVIRFTDAGSVGIGTTSPYAKLSVVGQVVAEYFTATSTTAANTFPLLVSTSATSTNLYGGTLTANTAAFGQTATSSFSSNGTLTAQNIINSGLSANQLIYTNASKQEVSVATGTVSSGTGISVTAGQYIVGPGLTITNTGVTSLVAGSGISVSGSTGAVTVTNSIGYPFPSNATSTSIAFNGGITTAGFLSTASSTINGSLVITGTATTSSLAVTGVTSSLLKTNSLGQVVAAVMGTDFVNGSGAAGNCVVWAASNGLTDAGTPCGSGSGSGDSSWTFFNGSGVRLATTTNQVVIGANATTTSTSKLEVAGGNILQYASGNPTVAVSTTTSSKVYATAIAGRLAYVAEYGNGLRIMDMSNPKSPKVVGSLSGIGNAVSVAVSGRYAYVGTESSVRIIDVTNPSAPVVAGTYSSLDFAYGVAVSGKYLLATDDQDGLRILDVSDPANPGLVGSYLAGSSDFYALAVAGRYAYIGDQSNGDTYIVDISNPASPVRVGTYNGSMAPAAFAVSGKYLYVGDAGGGFYALDVANPASPSLVGTYNGSGVYYGVAVAGDYAYLSDFSGKVSVVDVSNPASITLVGEASIGNTPWTVTVSGKYAYVADNTGGLKVIDINGAQLPSASIGSIETNSINVSDDLTVGNNITAGGSLNVGISGILSRGTISAYIASSTQTNPVVANFMGGNVGIGTTSPFARLSVAGDAYIGGNLTATGTLSVLTSASIASTTLTGNTLLSAATTTSLGITGITSSLLKTTSAGGVVAAIAGTDYVSPAGLASAYPFQLAGNATSTLTQFNGGLTAYASSTIGNGTQGLTINGPATTTTLTAPLNANLSISLPTNASTNGNTITVAAGNSSVAEATGGTLTLKAGSDTAGLGVGGDVVIQSGGGGVGGGTGGISFKISSTNIANFSGGGLFITNGGGLSVVGATALSSTLAVSGNTTLASASSTNLFSGRLTSNTAAFGGTGSTTISSTGALSTPTLTIGSLSGLVAANTGATYATATGTVSSGTGISVTAGQAIIGSGLTITNTGVTSLAGTANQITASASTGAVTLSLPSLVSLTNASSSQLSVFAKAYFGATATSSFDSAGVLTLASALTVPNGGTGATTFTAGNLIYGSGSGALQSVATSSATCSGGTSCSAFAVVGSVAPVISSFSYPFPSNATTTLLAFNGGLTTTNATSTTLFGGTLTASIASFGATATSSFSSAGVLTAQNIINSGLSANQLIYTNASKQEVSVATGTVSSGTGISVTAGQAIIGSGLTITNTGVTSLAGTANQITASASTGAVTLSLPSLVSLTNASSSQLSVFAKAYFGATATSSFSSAGVLNLAGITSSLLKTDGSNNVVAAVAGTDYVSPAGLASAYPFQLAGNATSTLTQFNGGLTAYASSTIGAGGQATGLTVSGGATTTGNAYFAGNVGIGQTAPTGKLSIVTAPSGTTDAPGWDLLSTHAIGSITSGSFTIDAASTTFNPSGSFAPATNITATLNAGRQGFSLSSLTLGNLGNSRLNNITTNGNAIVVTGSPVFNDAGAGAGNQNKLQAYGVNSSVAVTPIVTADNSGSAQFISAAGTFSNASSLSSSVLGGGATAYGLNVSNSAVLNNPGSVAYGQFILNAAVATTTYGLYITRSDSASSANTTYGLRLDGPTGAISNDYSLYSSGTAQSYFAGNVGIGTTSPYRQLSIGNSAVFGGDVTAAGFTATSTIASTFLNASSSLLSVTNTLYVGGSATTTIDSTSINLNQFATIKFNGTASFYASSTLGSVYVGNAGPTAYNSGATNNTLLGRNAGNLITSGANNLVLGAWSTAANSNISSGSNNILLGFNNSLTSATANGQLNIQNILYGTGNTATGQTYGTGKVGIGSSTPFARLSIHANNGDANTTLFAIGSSTANATTTLFAIDNTGTVSANNIIPNGPYTNNLASYDLGATNSRWNAVWTGALNVGTSTFSLKSDASSNLGFYTAASGGGTQAMTITTAGNVGIGTSSPTAKFSVASSSSATAVADFINLTMLNGATPRITIGHSASTTKWNIDNSSGDFRLYSSTVNDGSGGTTALQISGANRNVGVGSTTPWGRLSIDTSSLAANVPSFSIGSSTRTDLVVTQAGNVGIGTTAPSSGLSVTANSIAAPSGAGVFVGTGVSGTNGGVQVNGTSPFIDFANTSGIDNDFRLGFAASTNLLSVQSSTTANILNITAGGNVGIGTTTPQAWLSVVNPTASKATVAFTDSSSGNQTVAFNSTGGHNTALVYQNNYANEWYLLNNAGSSNAFNIFGGDATGNVLAVSILQSGAINFSSGLTASATGNYLCINTTTFEVTRGNGSTCTTSDARFKKNITDLPQVDGLAALSQLRPVTFNWRSKGESTGTQYGFIAQEVQNIFPDFVNDNGTQILVNADGSTTTVSHALSINYNAFVPVAVKAIQELDNRTDFFAATTTVDELLNATSTPAEELATSSPWTASFASAAQIVKDALGSLGDVVISASKHAIFATTGIFNNLISQTITANVVNADTVNAKQLCIEGVCVDRAELERLLNGSSPGPTSAAPPTDSGAGTTSTTTTTTSGSTDATSTPPADTTTTDTTSTPPADSGSTDTTASAADTPPADIPADTPPTP